MSLIELFRKKTLLITFLYAVVTFVFVTRHEIWADEAQVWLLLHNLSFSGLFQQLSVEGHPCFFYLIAMPSVKLGFSLFPLQIICWLSAVFSVFLLWHYSPFGNITKAAVTLSSGFIYYLPVMIRPYSLIVLLMFSAAILYRRRAKQPVAYAVSLACLANTHIIMLGFVLGMLTLFIYENRRNSDYRGVNIISVAIIAFSVLAAAYLAAPALNINQCFNSVTVNFSSVARVLTVLFGSLVFQADTNGILAIGIYAAITAIPFLGALYILKKRDLPLFFAAAAGILFQLYIYSFKYSLLFPARTFIIPVILITCFWMAGPEKKDIYKKSADIIIAALFLLTLPSGVIAAAKDFSGNYSGGKEMAAFIKKNIGAGDSVLVSQSPVCCSVSLVYYLRDRELYFNGRKVEYTDWRKVKEPFAPDIGAYKNKKVYFIITDADKNINIAGGYKMMYKTKPSAAPCETLGIIRVK